MAVGSFASGLLNTNLLRSFIAGLLLAGCSVGAYVPRIRDVTEQPISGGYWYQQFTLDDPANFGSACQISRTGQRIDLNSPVEIVDAWRQFCRSYSQSRD
jgi:hypothetical protein